MYDFSHYPVFLKCSSQDCGFKFWIILTALAIPAATKSKKGAASPNHGSAAKTQLGTQAGSEGRFEPLPSSHFWQD